MTILSMPVLWDCTCGAPVNLEVDGDGAREVCAAGCGMSQKPQPPERNRAEVRAQARHVVEAARREGLPPMKCPSCKQRRHDRCHASGCECPGDHPRRPSAAYGPVAGEASAVEAATPPAPSACHAGAGGAAVSGPTPEVVALVLARDGWCCVVGGEPLTGERGRDWALHHRRGRDGKPDSHQPQNLISVCGADNVSGCHGRIHGRRSEAQPAGWWLSRVAETDPLTAPVLVDRESRWVYLTADGFYSDDPPEVA